MRQNLRRGAALIRISSHAACACLVAFCFLQVLPLQADTSSSAQRRDDAKSQFDRAEKARADLETLPEAKRTAKEYATVAEEYRRVYLITAHAAEVPDALNEVAVLYRKMGDLFGAPYYQKAIQTYQYLAKDYPTSRYREDALIAVGQIEQDNLHDPTLARQTYQEFLSLHPHSHRTDEVKAALAKLSAADRSATTAVAPHTVKAEPAHSEPPESRNISGEKAPPATDTKESDSSAEEETDSSNSTPRVSRIRTWNADTYTRIMIDVGAPVKYQAARISDPDRIYFDIEGARISTALLRKAVEINPGGFLKTVRIAQNQTDVVRIVLEVNRVKDYSVFLLSNPYRLVVDIYGDSATETADKRGPLAPTERETANARPSAQPESAASRDSGEGKLLSGADVRAAERAKLTSKDSGVRASRVQSDSVGSPTAPAARPAMVKPDSPTGSASASASGALETPGPKPALQANPARTRKFVDPVIARGALPLAPASASAFTLTAAVLKKPAASKSAHEQAAELGPPPIPDLTLDGRHSLTRALGLKVGRIVIDAGHGGHDTGTIGPTGLMEKDICLDIALRLGKLIQQKLPSADVVYTRDDDTFVPLERRTEIANEAKADLFLSIHANSSEDRQVRGVETYYLNFTASSDSMEVATRENALSDNSVHNLQDIVAQIARNEKIEESRDFASMIQDSLAKRIESYNRGDHSRGVRKAPFVVLIGADMPSVLAEISFLSNPGDEQWLKKPENRQRIADGLYRGIQDYLQSTNSLSADQVRSSAEMRSGAVARTGNPQ